MERSEASSIAIGALFEEQRYVLFIVHFDDVLVLETWSYHEHFGIDEVIDRVHIVLELLLSNGLRDPESFVEISHELRSFH